VSMSDVQHQSRAHRVLQQAIASHRMPHAYLFAGPEGVGKEMMALGLAQTLLCSAPATRELPDGHMGLDACGECADCRLVLAGTHPDLCLVYRQLNKQHPDSGIRKQRASNISVDVIRHFLIDRTGTVPTRGRARVFIIRDAERMEAPAQNSLLKTLEEPPRATFLILLTSGMDRMLPTTRSRCQQVLFGPLPADFVEGRLRELRPDADPQELAYAARHADGSLGAALRFVDDGLFEIKRKWGGQLLELVQPPRGFAPHALSKPLQADAKTLGERISERDPDASDSDVLRAGLGTLLAVLGGFYVDALRRATGAEIPLVNADQPEVIEKLVATRPPAALISSLRRISEADTNLARNASMDLTLETMFIQLAR
jgi:DNA polymerase III subunit delta'